MSDRFTNNTNRLAIKSRFLYGLSGSDEVSEVEARLQNCVILENDRMEARLGAQELECWGRGSSSIVAGQISQVGLIIPAASGVVVVIEAIVISVPSPLAPPSSMVITRQYSAGTPGGSGSAIARDTRAGSSRTPACQLVQSAARVGTITWVQPAALPSYVGPEIVMAASDTAAVAIWVDCNVIATAADVNFCWRERVIEGGFLS